MIYDECDTITIDGVTYSVLDDNIVKLEQIKLTIMTQLDQLNETIAGYINIDIDSTKELITRHINTLMILFLERKILDNQKDKNLIYPPTKVHLLH